MKDNGLDPARNIAVTISTGETCFWCKQIIPKKLKCVAVTFEVDLLIKTITPTKLAHAVCAEEAARALLAHASRIFEADAKL